MFFTRGFCRCPSSWHGGLEGARPRQQIIIIFPIGKLTFPMFCLDATRTIMQTCYFSSKETRTCSDDKRWRADDENQSFLIRKATLLIGHVPAMLCQTLCVLRELARGMPICCTCYFTTTKSDMSWPCAPLRDETSARRNGAARGTMRKHIVF